MILNKITYILFDFYEEFTDIQGKSYAEIGKIYKSFLTALVAKDLSHEKAKKYLEKSDALRQSKSRAGLAGANKRWHC